MSNLKDGIVLDGRYEVLELLDGEGNGSLYRGRHLQLDRPVAIKILQVNSNAGQNPAIGLAHPNICQMYEGGKTEVGAPYVVMDFLDGRTFDEIIFDLGPMPVRRAIPSLTQTGQGLGYAHSKGVFHGALRMSTVMVVSDNGQESVKIIDFAGTGDAKADISAFGRVMYELLTGVAPTTSNPPPMSQAAPGVSVPPALEAIVTKCMQGGYANCAEIVDALSKVSVTGPVAAEMEPAPSAGAHTSMTPSAETGNKVRTNMLLVLAIPVVLAALAAMWVVSHPPQAQAPAVQSQQR